MKQPRPLRIFALLTLTLLFLGLWSPAGAQAGVLEINALDFPVTREGTYSSLEEVAVYLDTFGELPSNFLTKREAQNLGWNSREGNLFQVAPGASIGGDFFGNYEDNPDLPKGKKWTECDVNFDGGFRGGERLVFSQDGLIYYTADHYNHFTQVAVLQGASSPSRPETAALQEDGAYTSKEEVAAFIHQFATLPYNYLTKDEARELGWTPKKDNLGQVAPGYAIGGDSFGNREGLLPKAQGRVWWECDVNVTDGRRSRERLVFSNDGLIYYTADNYHSFEKLYE
ncbi:MAG: ribonuclease domain-containing protein [Candidatus Limiplasma sp.]|nr:ribonuclease domain-containing protein [Candidatus Limiplasma sp.]